MTSEEAYLYLFVLLTEGFAVENSFEFQFFSSRSDISQSGIRNSYKEWGVVEGEGTLASAAFRLLGRLLSLFQET